MKIQLGIIAPFFIQIGLLFLYSSIKYHTINNSILSAVILLIFPAIFLYLTAPFILIYIGKLESRIKNKLSKEFDDIILSNLDHGSNFEDSKNILREQLFFDKSSSEVVTAKLKTKLIPLLTKRAIEDYKDNFYSRTSEIRQEKSLDYFESLALFSIINFYLFVMDLIILNYIKLASLNLYFIELDDIQDFGIFLTIFIFFSLGLLLSYSLFYYAINRMEYYLPYSVPILFNENPNEKYLRRETIRSIISYNFDNLINRKSQRGISSIIEESISEILKPLLQEEILINARTEFANKIAWKEYSNIIQEQISKEEILKETRLEQLFIGNSIGNFVLPEKDLLGLNSDLEYIFDILNEWQDTSNDTKVIAFFQLYRIVEYIIKELTEHLKILNEGEENNLYNGIKGLVKNNYITKEEEELLHNLRHQRNKLMHEPGIILDVSNDTFTSDIEIINNILNKIDIKEN